MSDRFLSSDEYDELAHRLYNQGRYDDALAVLKDGIHVYPHYAELHVGMGYAYLVREEYAWAQRSFHRALSLDPNHEDALAGLGEVLLKIGRRTEAIEHFEHIIALGFGDDHDLMLQMGRALFREGLVGRAHRYFDFAVTTHPESAEASACVGYATHRLGREGAALFWLRRALSLDSRHTEARIYLANMLYDRGETAAALYHLERTTPEDHFDDLALWRVIELKKARHQLTDADATLAPWFQRLVEMTSTPEAVDVLLAEVESLHPGSAVRDPNQLELFGALVSELQSMQRPAASGEVHLVATLAGHLFKGTWEEILQQMKAADREAASDTVHEFMSRVAKRGHTETGIVIPVTTAEAFIRGSAEAGVLRIIR